MLTERSSLLANNRDNNARTKLYGDKIIRHLKDLFYYLLKTVIFGGSLKAGLDVYLESWQYDIQQAGFKDFDTQTISRIGAYLALIGGLLGYLAYHKLYNADLSKRINYIIYKITQAIAAWGLHSYLLKLFLFAVTESCAKAFHGGNIDYCPNSSNEPVPLNIFCCVDKENTTDFNYPTISLNEVAFITSAALSMQTIWYASPVFRYEFKKKPWVRSISDILSLSASAVSYAITKFAITARLPLVWYTAIPLGTFHFTRLLSSIPTLATPVNPEQNNSVIIELKNHYKNGLSAAFLTGIGGAALLHSMVYTLELHTFSKVELRYVLQFMAAAGASTIVAYQANRSQNPQEFTYRLLSYFLPKILLEKIYCLPTIPVAQRPALTVNQDTQVLVQPVREEEQEEPEERDIEQAIIEQQQTINTDNSNNTRLSKKRAAAIVSSAAITFAISETIFHYMIDAIPLGTPPQIIRAWEARGLRFAFAIAGLLIYGGTTYGEPLNIAEDLNADWPAFSDIATFLIMSIGLFEAIKDETNPHQTITIILASLLLAACLLGNTSFKRIVNLFTATEDQPAEEQEPRVLIEEIESEEEEENQDTNVPPTVVVEQPTQRNHCDPRGWFNNWCCFNRSSENSRQHPNGQPGNHYRTSPLRIIFRQ